MYSSNPKYPHQETYERQGIDKLSWYHLHEMAKFPIVLSRRSLVSLTSKTKESSDLILVDRTNDVEIIAGIPFVYPSLAVECRCGILVVIRSVRGSERYAGYLCVGRYSMTARIAH